MFKILTYTLLKKYLSRFSLMWTKMLLPLQQTMHQQENDLQWRLWIYLASSVHKLWFHQQFLWNLKLIIIWVLYMVVQVSLSSGRLFNFLFSYISQLIYVYRNIRSNFHISSFLPWILFPSKHQVCHVNEYSLQENRLWLHREIGFQLVWWNHSSCWSFPFVKGDLWSLQKGWVGVKSWRSLSMLLGLHL